MYPALDPDELPRHATKVGRLLLDAGLAPTSGAHQWPPLKIFDYARVSSATRAHCHRHFCHQGLLLPAAGTGGVFFFHLLHTAWLLAHGYIYQDHEGLYWVDPRQPYDYSLNYELAEATLAELIGLGQLKELVEFLRRSA